MPAASANRAAPTRPALIFLMATLAGGVVAASAHAAGLAHPALPGRLSDERTLTRWTTALTRTPIRRAPTAGSPALARLRYYTEDRLPEIYVGLEQARGVDGRAWV